MRVKLVLAMIAGMLFCTLATLEVPELLTLTDNTSNDYSLTAVQEATPPAVARQTAKPPRVQPFKSVTPRRQSAARLQAVSFEPSVADFLRSLCVLRT